MRPAALDSLLHTEGLRKRNLAGMALNVGVAILGAVLARFLASFLQIALARWMGVLDYGLYTSLYTLLGPVIVISSLGLDTWLLRQAGNPTTLSKAISQVFSLRLVLTSGLMGVAIVGLVLRGEARLTIPIVLAAALGLGCEILLTTAHTALRAQVRNLAAGLLQVFVASLMIALVVMFWDDRRPVLTVAVYRLAADLAGVALAAWLLHRSLQLIVNPGQVWSMVRAARIYFVSDILAAITLKADLTLVALLIGSLAAGIYGPALVIVNTTFLVPHVLWQVLVPVLARQSTGHRLKVIFWLDFGCSLCYGLFWTGVFWWGAEWIVHIIYGQEYSAAAPLLQIMSLIPLLKSLSFCWVALMVARDQQVLRTKLQAVGSVVNAAGNLLLIPLFGLAGAAWINLATEVVLLIGYSYGGWLTLKRRS